MRRFFSKRQRKIIYFLSGKICEICKKKISEKFHADHKKAFSKGGKTILKNAQALCKKCNLIKGCN